MLISRLRRFVYLGSPKTGSTSLHEWLSHPLLCERPWCPNDSGQHDMEPPDDARAFFTFASVRNPYSRAVSLWRHSLSASSMESSVIPCLGFAEFVEWLPIAPKFYAASQADWLAENRLDAIVRIEQIASVLAIPPIAPCAVNLPPIPRLNATAHEGWRTYYDRWLARAICQYFVRDFVRFGYRTEWMGEFDSVPRARPRCAPPSEFSHERHDPNE